MSEDKSIAEHDRLNAAFDSKSVLTADTAELERLLLATCETRFASPENPAALKAKKRAEVIRHLLQVRLTTEIGNRSYRVSILALVISTLALGWNICQAIFQL
ncbi:MAG: hypothetical protein AB1813_16360 [Verrucomicrobiota bacterium]